jgi:hypothetical protein
VRTAWTTWRRRDARSVSRAGPSVNGTTSVIMCLRTAGPSARSRSMAVRRGDERALRRRGLSLGHPRHLHVPQAGHRVAGGGQVGAEEPQLGVVMGVQRGVGAGEEGQLRARGDGLSVGRVPERGKREAATAAAGRVGCAATVSRPPGPGLDTGLAALLDHRDGRCCPNGVRRAEFLAERAPGAFCGTRRKGRRLPIPRAGNQQIEISSTPPTCVVGEPSPARAGGGHARAGACRAFPPVRVDLAPVEVARLAEQPIIVAAWAAVPDEAPARSDETAAAGCHSTARGPFPGSQGDHRIVDLRSTRDFCA